MRTLLDTEPDVDALLSRFVATLDEAGGGERHRRRRPAGARSRALAAAGADVALRVQALLSPRRESRLLSALLLISVALAIAISAASVLWLGHDVRSIILVAHRGL
jgi:hypothetical protein